MLWPLRNTGVRELRRLAVLRTRREHVCASCCGFLMAAILASGGTASGASWCTYSGQQMGPDCPPLDSGQTMVTFCVRCTSAPGTCPNRPFFYIVGRQCAIGQLTLAGPTCGDCAVGTRYVLVTDADIARCGPGVEDGLDNDGDGLIDEEACDGFDNDADGRVDEDTYHAYIVPEGALDVDDSAWPDMPAMQLRGPWPNPFSSQLSIAFDVPRASILRLAILDITGRMVRRLLEGVTSAGRHEIHWDGRDTAGRPAPTGLYLIWLSGGMRPAETRWVVLRR